MPKGTKVVRVNIVSYCIDCYLTMSVKALGPKPFKNRVVMRAAAKEV